MKKESTPPKDDFMIRCRRLGHPVPFSYCRYENKGLPCSKVVDCWYDYFMIEDYLRQDLAPEDWDRAFLQPVKPKVLSLVELIEEAKKKKTEEP